MDRHDSPTVSFTSVRTGLNEVHCYRLGAAADIGATFQKGRARGWRDLTKPWPTITRRSDLRLLGVQFNRSRRNDSRPGRPMTRVDLLFLVSVVWFVTLCGVVGWLITAG
jgi:hypothetical protein